MKNPLARLILILTVVVMAGLACSIPGGSGSIPPTAKPMTTEEVKDLGEQLQKTLENPNPSGEVIITLTQDQMNGIVAGEIQRIPDLGISDPSVVLTGGNMEVYGKVMQSGISANLKVVLRPEIDGNGSPKISILSMNLGALPVPDVLKERVATAADDALTNYIHSNSSFQVKSITIGEGHMTITGTKQ